MRRASATLAAAGPAVSAPGAPPPLGVVAWSRIGFGPTPGDLVAFQALGATDDERLEALVEQQLDPASIPDTDAETRIAASGYQTLAKSRAQLWADHVTAGPPWSERMRPVREIALASFLRAVYSRRQLVEVLADFWHNHFNVYAWDFWTGPTWVHYDRDVIRAHLLGNFRQMLEAVAKSPPMLFYLDNWTSAADGPNENYSRELLELHTLGSEHYLGTLPASQVPLDGGGTPVAFVDEDVFALTRCLTGWSIAGDPWWDPSNGDGSFLFRAGWHDGGAKTLLGVELPAGQPGEQDGQDALDLLAAHPGTGRHIARKLCRRLIGDEPPVSIVETAAQLFTAQVSAPDQLEQVVRVILLSDEFKTTWGDKVRRPFEIVVGAMRAGGADFPFVDGDPDTDTFDWLYYNTGQDLFSWRAPNGYPDAKEDWVSTGPRVMCWRLLNWLVDSRDDLDNYRLDAFAQTPAGVRSANALVDFWVDRVLGRTIADGDRQELVELMAQGHNPDFDLPLDTDTSTRERLQALLGLIFMMPEFLWK
ncbi:MAG: DUF1800 domain-containing protein [Thermoanaerobaculia bacterium]|nr:DUF1800 domain-containing protein [Thermoanaerobaculia bacterium]